MVKSKIENFDFALNPVIGCLGTCPFCYARIYAKRFSDFWSAQQSSFSREEARTLIKNFKPVFMNKRLLQPLPKKYSRIFVNPLSDPLYWKYEWLFKIADLIRAHPEHDFFILTKTPAVYERNRALFEIPNLWRGVTITGDPCIDRIYREISFGGKRETGMFAGIDWIMAEPLLGNVKKHLWRFPNLRWLVAGPQNGGKAAERRIPHYDDITDIVEYCHAHHIPLWIKRRMMDCWDGTEYRHVPRRKT